MLTINCYHDDIQHLQQQGANHRHGKGVERLQKDMRKCDLALRLHNIYHPREIFIVPKDKKGETLAVARLETPSGFPKVLQ